MNKSTSQSAKQISNLPSVPFVPAVPSSQRMSTSTKSPSVLFLQPSQPSHPSHTANSLRSSHSSINPQPLQTSQTPQRKMSIYANPHIPDPQLQRISTSQASRQTERAEQTHYSQPPQFTEISEPPHYSQPLELAELDQMARMAGMSDMAGMAEIEQITRTTDMTHMIQRKNSTYTNPNFNKDNQSTELTQPTQHAQSAQNSRRMSSVYANPNMNQNMTDQQMLLNISSDEKFIDECNSNPNLREICKSPDIWQRRLEKYYPQVIDTMKLTELNPIQFYPIATLFKRYVQLLVLEKQGISKEDPVFWRVNEVKNDFNFAQNQIAEYLQKFNFDYSLVLSLKFLNLFIFYQL